MALTSSATVVVVERDSAAQELIEQTLRRRGHRVLVTSDPLEALRLGQRIRFDVLVGDVELYWEWPSLIERLRSMQPDLRLVRISETDEQTFSELEDGVTLGRPFSLDELEHAVAQVLKRDPSVE